MGDYSQRRGFRLLLIAASTIAFVVFVNSSCKAFVSLASSVRADFYQSGQRQIRSAPILSTTDFLPLFFRLLSITQNFQIKATDFVDSLCGDTKSVVLRLGFQFRKDFAASKSKGKGDPSSACNGCLFT